MNKKIAWRTSRQLLPRWVLFCCDLVSLSAKLLCKWDNSLERDCNTNECWNVARCICYKFAFNGENWNYTHSRSISTLSHFCKTATSPILIKSTSYRTMFSGHDSSQLCFHLKHTRFRARLFWLNDSPFDWMTRLELAISDKKSLKYLNSASNAKDAVEYFCFWISIRLWGVRVFLNTSLLQQASKIWAACFTNKASHCKSLTIWSMKKRCKGCTISTKSLERFTLIARSYRETPKQELSWWTG